MTTAETVIVMAFTNTNVGRVLAYLPQLVTIARSEGRASAVSGATWTLFLVSNASSALYATAILDDAVMGLIFAVNAACCLAIVGLLTWKRTMTARILVGAGCGSPLFRARWTPRGSRSWA